MCCHELLLLSLCPGVLADVRVQVVVPALQHKQASSIWPDGGCSRGQQLRRSLADCCNSLIPANRLETPLSRTQRHAQMGHTCVSGMPHLSALLANAPLVLTLAKGLVELLRDDCPLALAIPLHKPAWQQGEQADGPVDPTPTTATDPGAAQLPGCPCPFADTHLRSLSSSSALQEPFILATGCFLRLWPAELMMHPPGAYPATVGGSGCVHKPPTDAGSRAGPARDRSSS